MANIKTRDAVRLLHLFINLPLAGFLLEHMKKWQIDWTLVELMDRVAAIRYLGTNLSDIPPDHMLVPDGPQPTSVLVSVFPKAPNRSHEVLVFYHERDALNHAVGTIDRYLSGTSKEQDKKYAALKAQRNEAWGLLAAPLEKRVEMLRAFDKLFDLYFKDSGELLIYTFTHSRMN